MKKTIPTSIANTLFYIEEDTYKELDEYLSSIREHFASSPDSIEIIHDIEDRIREQFIEFTGGENRGENKNGSERIITAAHVAELIKRMGRPEDFGDETNDTTGKAENANNSEKKSDSYNKHSRKFYRDTDHQVIAGVASGIGAYLNVDPVVVRILFLISIFLGGAGIIAYIVLWIAVPEAKTASQKLEMQGDPVTLRSVSEKIKEKINTIDKDDIKDKAKNAGSAIGTVAERIVRVLAGIIGVAFKIIAIVAILGISFAFFMAAFSHGAGIFDFPVNTFLSAPMYYILLSIIFLISIIPFIFLNTLGSIFLKKKTFFRGTAATVLFSIWMIAIFGGITFAATVGKNVATYVENDPKFQETSQTISLGEFDSLIAQNAQNITVVSGTEYSATITGRQNDIDRVAFDPIDKTLRIHNKTDMNLCFFCYRFGTTITLTTPKALVGIETQNASKIMYEGTFADLDLKLQNASMIYLKGTANKLTAKLENASKLDAGSLVTKNIDLSLQNASKAEVHATESLTGEAMNASKIEQYGKADIDDIKTNNGSAVTTLND